MDTLTVRFLAGGLLAAIYSFSSKAEITLDGSLGPAGGAIPLGANNQIEIREDMGRTVGNNLFHSFRTFNIGAGETAAFTGTSPIDNILSRVTGGTASNIDGTLRTDFANSTPNLFLLNPAGVVFGPNASLDVQGSFHVSTADYLRLEDGTRFNSQPAVEQILTTAPPEAFGFLGDNPGNISIEQASLAVPDGESLSVIGGDMSIQGGELLAPAGRIDMASVKSPGEVIRTDTDLRLEGFDSLGRIELDQVATVDTSGEGGGAIFIRGGELLVKNSVVKSRSLGNTIGQAIDIDLPNGFLELRDGGVIDTATRGAGRGGDLFVNAQNISMNGDGSEFNTGLVANSSSTGDGGRIVVRTESLEVLNRAEISVNAFDAGDGGELLVEANSIVISHDGGDSPAGFYALTTSGGDAGRITVRSNSLDVRNGATINTSTAGDGNGGEVFIEADNLLFTGRGSIGAIANGGGDGGAVFVRADRAEILDGAFISTATGGIGKGSNLSIEARDIVLAGGAQLGSGALSTGEAGTINIKAHSLEIRDGAVIFNRSESEGNGGSTLIESREILVTGNSRILTGTLSKGDAGSLTIRADSLDVSRGGVIDLSSLESGKGGDLLIEASDILLLGDETGAITGMGSGTGPGSTGDAGSITLKAENLEVRNGAGISTTTLGAGKGGDVFFEAGNILFTNSGPIGSLAASSGAAGNVTIKGDNVEVRDGSFINTSTRSTGTGGDIFVTAGNVLLSGDGAIGLTGLATASTDGAGNAGNVTIEATNLKVRDGATINLLTGAAGNGGNLNVKAENVMLSGEGTNATTGFLTSSASTATGNAGSVTVHAEDFEMREAIINASTFGTGQGGDIDIDAGMVSLGGKGVDRNTIIAAVSGSGGTGKAGNITIEGNQNVRFLNGSIISVETFDSDGGDIIVSAEELIQFRNSVISTSVANGQGNGGNISIDPTFVVMDDSAIVANAARGRGGNIDLVADFFFRSRDSIVDASSDEGGIDGTVDIVSPDTTISGSIAVLPETYINAADQLSERCGARSANRNSFVIKGRGRVPLAPGDLAPASASDGLIGDQTSTSELDQLRLAAGRQSPSNDARQLVTGCRK